MKRFFLFLFSLSIILSAQSKDANKILKAVNERFNKVNDYQADVIVKLDMEFVKVPDSKARVYFKQPDKFKIESDGFSMLPKQSMNFSPAQLLKGDYTSVFVRSETVGNKKLDVVKIIPNVDTSDIVLSTMWIDPAQSIIYKVETTTKRSGTVLTEFSYDAKSIPLPSVLKFSFNMGEMKMPDMMQQKEEENQKSRNKGSRIKGSVIMNYSNYQINKGIADKIFEEKKSSVKNKSNHFN